MAVYEGKWRCTSCGTLNRGASRRCVCGNPRGGDEEIFVETDAPAVTDPTLLAAAEAGSNWFCGYCGAENVHGATTCKQCNGSREQSSDARKVQIVEPGDEGERPPGPRVRAEPAHAAPLLSRRGWVIVGAVVLVFIAVGVWLFWASEVQATVTETHWARSIQIDQLGPREEGWERPVDSELLHSEQRPRAQSVAVPVTRTRKATKEVPTGQTRTVKTGRKIDLGNGFFKDEEKEIPVTKSVTYDEEYQTVEMQPTVVPATWYAYRRWQKLRTEELSGEREPHWPAVTLLPEQRFGPRREQFSVVFTAEGKTYRHNPKEEVEFQQFQKGSVRRLKVNNAGWILGIE